MRIIVARTLGLSTFLLFTWSLFAESADAAPPRGRPPARGGPPAARRIPGRSRPAPARPRSIRTLPSRPNALPQTFFNRGFWNPFLVPTAVTLPSPSLPVNPNFLVAPGLTVRQFAFNQALINRAQLTGISPFAFSAIPSMRLGFTPFNPFLFGSPFLTTPTSGFNLFNPGFNTSTGFFNPGFSMSTGFASPGSTGSSFFLFSSPGQ